MNEDQPISHDLKPRTYEVTVPAGDVVLFTDEFANPEIQAMAFMLAAVENLTEAERKRAVRWLAERVAAE